MKTKICVMGGFLLVGSMTGLTACTSIFSDTAKVDVRPILQMADSPSDNSFYQSAVGAMNRRDYALALDYLQAARGKDPGNVRILNAFGVVYDKLGRFDLSARYYAQASAIEPKSAIVAANMAYSRMLQGFLNPQSAAPQLASIDTPQGKPALRVEPTESLPFQPALAPSEVQQTQLAASEEEKDSTPLLSTPSPSRAVLPARILTGAAGDASMHVTKVSPVKQLISEESGSSNATLPLNRPTISPKTAPKALILIGYPLRITNASGRQNAVDAVRRNLAARGWTLSRSVTVAPQNAFYTALIYPKANLNAARGLARTLPFPVRLTANTCDCGGLALVIGSDFKDWKANRKIEVSTRMEVSIAALSGSERKGVR